MKISAEMDVYRRSTYTFRDCELLAPQARPGGGQRKLAAGGRETRLNTSAARSLLRFLFSVSQQFPVSLTSFRGNQPIPRPILSRRDFPESLDTMNERQEVRK